MDPLVSIVIATVFNDDTVRRCVDCIKRNTTLNYELIVMDNGSEARGCVRAYNQGLAAADGDVLVCMNDDAQPQPGWLEPLAQGIRQEGLWLCCPQWNYARIAGFCMAFSREAYAFTGGFCECYLHWSADHHFECLLAKYGKPIRQIPESRVVHDSDDLHRIHFRRSQLQEESGLPNTGLWYIHDNRVFHGVWNGVVPSDFWPPSPEDWSKTQ